MLLLSADKWMKVWCHGNCLDVPSPGDDVSFGHDEIV